MKLASVWKLAIYCCLGTGLSACGPDDVQLAETGRGQAGLGEGSCAGACGGQSADGCWCDASCAGWGDCCADYEPVCVAPNACAAVDCAPGYHCEEQEIVCVTWPCPSPIGVCVPDVDPCAAIDCAPGYHCEPQDVVCITWPCPSPIGVCVQDDVCDGYACPPGSHCEAHETFCGDDDTCLVPFCEWDDVCEDFTCPPGSYCVAQETFCGLDQTCVVPACEPACLCPEIYAPVCGVDGVTYSNGCHAGCAGIEILHDGEC